MSERGSFVTQYIYCPICFEEVKKVLCQDDKYLKGVAIPIWSGCTGTKELPIIAGKIGGLYSGEEADTFEYKINPIIKEKICHEVVIVVLCDDNTYIIFRIGPGWQRMVSGKVEDIEGIL